ncbi:MAG: hypothetical protein V2A34_08965 [Lentisphaerota bacterium]
MRCRMLCLAGVFGLLIASVKGALGAWDLENGDFSEGTRLWVTNLYYRIRFERKSQWFDNLPPECRFTRHLQLE